VATYCPGERIDLTLVGTGAMAGESNSDEEDADRITISKEQQQLLYSQLDHSGANALVANAAKRRTS
jgi:hypothetical protein